VVATRRNNLALVLQDLGELAGARTLFAQALASSLKTYGEDHPAVATDRNNLALVLQDLGEHAAARRLYEQALASSLKTGRPAARHHRDRKNPHTARAHARPLPLDMVALPGGVVDLAVGPVVGIGDDRGDRPARKIVARAERWSDLRQVTSQRSLRTLDRLRTAGTPWLWQLLLGSRFIDVEASSASDPVVESSECRASAAKAPLRDIGQDQPRSQLAARGLHGDEADSDIGCGRVEQSARTSQIRLTEGI
jgi:tetratricopeptide (TPR) repeat protein